MRRCLIAAGLILAIAPVGAVEYLTAGADPQRTGWVKDEKVFSPSNVSRASGRELWTSGRAITSPARRPSLWAGIGQVHVATADNTVYAFGFAMERD